MKIHSFKKASSNGFNFVFEYDLKQGETVIVKMPTVTANKRGVNDIGWMCDGNVTLYGTLSENPKTTDMWQEIQDHDDINKVTSAIKIQNNGEDCTIIIRAIFS